MRYMMLMIPAGYQHDAPADLRPDVESVEKMGRFNADMLKAGVMLSGDGLHPPITGARVRFAGGKPTISDGPFTESKEVLGGYWIISVKSHEEAVQWAARCPAADGDMIEVRRIFEMEDFPADVQAAAQL